MTSSDRTPQAMPSLDASHPAGRARASLNSSTAGSSLGSTRDDDDDDSTPEADAVSVASTVSWPDRRGFRGCAFAKEHTKVVYKAYEIILRDAAEQCEAWKSPCSLGFGKAWRRVRGRLRGPQARVSLRTGRPVRPVRGGHPEVR